MMNFLIQFLLALSVLVSHPVAQVQVSHNDRAYNMAARAIMSETREHPTLSPQFVSNGMQYGLPVYKPHVFVGLEWYCDPLKIDPNNNETCYAGEIWEQGIPKFQTGP